MRFALFTKMKIKIDIKKSIIHAIQGALVGVGAILPGISGGVLCVVFGIYETLMAFFTNPVKAVKENYKMLIPFGIGGVLGFFLLARLVEIFFAFAPDVAILLFFGLVCGTLPELFKRSEEADPDRKAGWLPFVISVSVSYLFFHILDGGEALVVPANFVSFLFCGFMWGISIIVPGLSSSSLLIYLGLYEPLAGGIADFNLGVLIPFGIGIVITVLLLARVVNMLFKKQYAIVSRIILGFVISSSLKTIPRSFESVWTMIISLVCFALGFAVAYIMDRAENKQNTEEKE